MSYADYVQKNLFDKAGMKDSYYCSERKIHKNHAHGYDTDSTGLVLKGYLDHTWPYAAGSLCSSAADLVAWNQAMHGGKLLSPAMYAELIKPAELNDGTKLRYSKGLALVDIDGHKAIHHGGGINGFLSESEYFPNDSLIIVVLFNTGGPVGPADIAHKIAEAVLGTAPEVNKPLEGDPAQFTGTYKGVGRGRASEMTVSVDNGALMLGSGGGPNAKPQKLNYLGNDTFAEGSNLLAFKRAGGKVTGFDFDAGYGHYKLTRQ
jgi:CubicO group peptidase (beta-lactamase class C family)